MRHSHSLEYHRERFLFWLRRATLAWNSQMGINREHPRTVQLCRLHRQAERLYRRAQAKADAYGPQPKPKRKRTKS